MRQVFVLGKWSFEWTGWGGMTCPTRGCCMSSGRECRIPKALWRFGRNRVNSEWLLYLQDSSDTSIHHLF